jgi:membrane glycosyltransferase
MIVACSAAASKHACADDCLKAAPAWLPDETPLVMRPQVLAERPRPAHPSRARNEADLWRAIAMTLTLATMAIAGVACHDVLIVDGFTFVDLIALTLFELLFGWIVFSAVVSMIGFAGARCLDGDLTELAPGSPLPAPVGRCAILMPIHNEEPGPVFDRLDAIDRSLRALGVEAGFDIFVLSDTRDPDIRAGEWRAFEALRTKREDRVFYRHRPVNEGRKAGNIAEWVNRFGGGYAYMVVLDADSFMTAETLVRLVGAMDAHPRIGLLQTVPRLINRTSLFGRLQQFSSGLYGPTMTAGLAMLWGSEGNYWGHNAAIRVRAFAQHAGLPDLKGPRPFGGEIRSHDFVEAALLRRAGWEVRVAPYLGGSYEECPPSLPALMARDRRWCQGNLQHLGVVGAAGLHGMSRFHLIYGALSYLLSPLWLAFLIVTSLLSLEGRSPLDSEWDSYNLSILEWVFSITLACLFFPKLAALGQTLAHARDRRAWGRVDRLVLSMLIETVLSTLIAPIVMVSQVSALVEILRGRDGGWSAQVRADGAIPWREAFQRHRLHTAMGVAFSVLFYMVSPLSVLWAAPTLLGLLFSAPLTVALADPRIGGRFLRWRLLCTPEEQGGGGLAV